MNFTSIEKAYTYSQSELILKKTKKTTKKRKAGDTKCDSFPFGLGNNLMTFPWGGREDKTHGDSFFLLVIILSEQRLPKMWHFA